MAQGNSKLYRVKEEYIKTVKTISNYYIELAWRDGYLFVQEEGTNEIRMITSTCSQKAFQIELINADVITPNGVKEFRF